VSGALKAKSPLRKFVAQRDDPLDLGDYQRVLATIISFTKNRSFAATSGRSGLSQLAMLASDFSQCGIKNALHTAKVFRGTALGKVQPRVT
jgi:hypothetical protein